MTYTKLVKNINWDANTKWQDVLTDKKYFVRAYFNNTPELFDCIVNVKISSDNNFAVITNGLCDYIINREQPFPTLIGLINNSELAFRRNGVKSLGAENKTPITNALNFGLCWENDSNPEPIQPYKLELWEEANVDFIQFDTHKDFYNYFKENTGNIKALRIMGRVLANKWNEDITRFVDGTLTSSHGEWDGQNELEIFSGNDKHTIAKVNDVDILTRNIHLTTADGENIVLRLEQDSLRVIKYNITSDTYDGTRRVFQVKRIVEDVVIDITRFNIKVYE